MLGPRCAASRDQVWIQHDRPVRVASALADLVEEQLDGQLTHSIPGKAHRGHRNAALRGEVIVVVADDYQFIGYPNSEIGRRLDNANSEQIRGAHDSIHRLGGQHLASDLAAGSDREVGRFYNFETGASFGNGPFNACQAPANESQLWKSGDEDEPARSSMKEMRGREIAAQFLVDHDAAREWVGRRCDHENDRAPVAKDGVCHIKRLFERSQ